MKSMHKTSSCTGSARYVLAGVSFLQLSAAEIGRRWPLDCRRPIVAIELERESVCISSGTSGRSSACVAEPRSLCDMFIVAKAVACAPGFFYPWRAWAKEKPPLAVKVNKICATLHPKRPFLILQHAFKRSHMPKDVVGHSLTFGASD